MKRKTRTALPRMTVMAMNRRELTSFLLAVEGMARKLEHLEAVVTRLEALEATKRSRRKIRENAEFSPQPN